MRRGEMRTTYHQRDDGQWFARDEGIGRYDGSPYVYWRPVYPPPPRAAYARVSQEEMKRPTAPKQPARFVSLDEPWVDEKMKRAASRLRSAGFDVDLQAAVTAADVHQAVMRGYMPDRELVVVLCWRWRPAGWTTMKGERVWREGSWQNEDAHIRASARMRREARVPTGKMSHTEAMRAVAP